MNDSTPLGGTHWAPLVTRAKDLPWVLAGPIVRKVTTSSVTIWMALRIPVHVVLSVRGNNGVTLRGETDSMPVGQQVHLLVITATGGQLPAGQPAVYDMSLIGVERGQTATRTLKEALCSETYDIDIALPGAAGPSVVPPPDDLTKVRIAHGSCRRPNGQEYDALAALDELLQDSNERPQILALTGDQIYADSSGIPFLFMTLDCADTLLGWRDPIPSSTPLDTIPGLRTALSKNAGFLESYPPHAHFLRFCEYFFAHLLVWSDVLWPAVIPTTEEMVEWEWRAMSPNDDDGQHDATVAATLTIMQQSPEGLVDKYTTDALRLTNFRNTLPKVRRTLANVATYMMWDDHDVTDDWFLSRQWCVTVLRSPTGRAAVRNGMMAFFLCQAIGNNPEDFLQPGGPNSAVLGHITAWLKEMRANQSGVAEAAKIEDELFYQPGGGAIVGAPDSKIKVHYRVVFPAFELIALDPRAHRTHPSTSLRDGTPLLINPDNNLGQQLPDVSDAPPIAVVISPCPVFGHGLLEMLQEYLTDNGAPNPLPPNSVATALIYRDAESWSLQEAARQALLARLAARTGREESAVVFLSGDVHYGFTFRIELVGQLYREGVQRRLIAAQLTSSSLRNETDLVERHTPLSEAVPTSPSGAWDRASGSTKLLEYAGFTYEGQSQFTVGETNAPGWGPGLGWEAATPSTGAAHQPVVKMRTTSLALDVVDADLLNETGAAYATYSKLLEPVLDDPISSPTMISTNAVTGRLRNHLWIDIPQGFPTEWGYKVDYLTGLLWGRNVATLGTWTLVEPGAQLVSALEGGYSQLRRALEIPEESLFSVMPGTELVGSNNFGLVSFEADGAHYKVHHALYHGISSAGSANKQTTWTVPLGSTALTLQDVEQGVEQ